MSGSVETILAEVQRIRDYTRIGSKDVLNLEEAALYCSLSKDYIYRRTSRNEIPHSRHGKFLYFSKKELDRWLLSERTATVGESRRNAALYTALNK